MKTNTFLAATHLPVVQLNFAAVSQDTPFSRDVVEGCVRETLLLLFRALASEKHVFLNFEGIGVLAFRNNKVDLCARTYVVIHIHGNESNLVLCILKAHMKFNRDFINAMDGTGRLLLAFKNVS